MRIDCSVTLESVTGDGGEFADLIECEGKLRLDTGKDPFLNSFLPDDGDPVVLAVDSVTVKDCCVEILTRFGARFVFITDEPVKET